MKVVSVNISEKKGTIKTPVPKMSVDEGGIVGDAHAGNWHRQISILSAEIIKEFESEIGRVLAPGEFAENITTRGVDLREVAILDRFTIGDVELEVTQIGKECHGGACAIFREVGKCVMPKEGLFARVIHGGDMKAGDAIGLTKRPLRVEVVTLSDRASCGEYEDKSGPEVQSLLEDYFKDKRWHIASNVTVLPDDAAQLRELLDRFRAEKVDIVLTTGGTGVGPRDITPDVVSGILDKQLPGIMENIRVKFGSEKPGALLSRGVAGVMGKMQVYTLPGSVKAVREYMGEILKTIEHVISTVHGIGTH
jgi:molybdopterin adenylyltransferase